MNEQEPFSTTFLGMTKVGATILIASLIIISLLCMLAVALFKVQEGQATTLCSVQKSLAAGQIKQLENLVASSQEFRDHDSDPHVRAFFKVSYEQRTAQLVQAKVRQALIKC